MNIKEVLLQSGLNNKEVAVYLCILELGSVNISQIVSKTKLKRPTLYYDVIPSLESQGLICGTVKGKRRQFLAVSLEKFFENKKKRLEELEKIIPEIGMLLLNKNLKPNISFYEGLSGIKKVWSSHLVERSPIKEFVSVENMNTELEKYVSNYYIRERVRRKIPVKMILSKNSTEVLPVKTNSLEMREVRHVNSSILKVPLCLDIYGNNISITLIREDSQHIGIIIKSKEISEFMDSMFELIWVNIK